MVGRDPDKLWEAMSDAWEWSSDLAADRLIEIRFCCGDDAGIEELSKLLTDSGAKCTQERAEQRKPSFGACWLVVSLTLRSLPKLLKALTPILAEWQKSQRPFDVVIKDRTLDIRVCDINDLGAVIAAVEKLQARSEMPTEQPSKRGRRKPPNG